MNRGHLPQSNPQLHNSPPHIPRRNHGTTQYQPPNVGALAAHALTSTLTNPYAPNSYSYTNANYHAYFTQAQYPQATPQGYTLSSTYVAQATSHQAQPQAPPGLRTQRGRLPNHQVARHVPRQFSGNSSYSSPGDIRCTHDGCSFSGNNRTVEIHMMDRHLIFPPGWKKRKSDWDADPSLKGKPVPIPGTGVMLNTPEAIDAWIAERRKKWPTNQRVEDKKRKVQEAADRGEIDPNELNRKRRRVDHDSPEYHCRERDRGRGRSMRRGDWRDRKTDSGWRGRGRGGGATAQKRPGTGANADGFSGGYDSASSHSNQESSDSASDMDPVKDAVSSKAPSIESVSRIPIEDPGDAGQQITHDGHPHIDGHGHVVSSRDLLSKGRPFRHQQLTKPRPPPPNPFAARPSLLRSLLLPEIRNTVSNISQAIHFLVENDFLEGVELKPGESDSQPIKILASSATKGQRSDLSTKVVSNAIQE